MKIYRLCYDKWCSLTETNQIDIAFFDTSPWIVWNYISLCIDPNFGQFEYFARYFSCIFFFVLYNIDAAYHYSYVKKHVQVSPFLKSFI